MVSEIFHLFYLNGSALSVAGVSTVILCIGIFVFLQNRKSISNFSFFLICLCVNFWLYGISLMYSCKNAELALQMYRWVTFLGVAYVSPCVYAFSVIWLNLFHAQKKWVVAGLVGAGIFYLLALLTPFGFKGVYHYFWGYYPIYGPIPRIFLGFFFVYFFKAFSNFVKAYRLETVPIRKVQIRLIAIAFLISFTGSVDYLPKFFYFPLYPIGYISVLIWILLVAYSIVKYKVMDIETVIHKTIMWFLTSLVFAAPLVVFFNVLRDWLQSLSSFAFLVCVAGSFIFLMFYARHIQPHIDHLFQRRQWDLIRALEKFNDVLVHKRSLGEVVSHILYTIQTIFYATRVTMLVRQENSDSFERMPALLSDPAQGLSIENKFLRWLEVNDTVVVGEYLDLDPRFDSIVHEAKQYFNCLHALICVPLVVNQRLIGVLNIGQKQNLQRFRSSDINFLAELRRSAAIALSNALHIIAMQKNLQLWNEELERKVAERTKQLEQTQAQLVQAEKLATIGTLAGGVAHEINNPLTAVLTNAQLLKMSASSEDLESITLIEEGARRCQNIIQKLMKYARKSTQEPLHQMVHLPNVIQNSVSMLAYQLKQENIELVTELEDLPAIEGNPNELEQAFTNLFVNSRDAIRAAGRPGKIHVKGFKKNGLAEIQVIDNGIGIKKENLSKIFDPFFTTKEVGMGTGLGLSVTYSILEKHRCQIEVSSEEGIGTTFVLRFVVNDSVNPGLPSPEAS
ncbi:MAG: ATP-binding protein [Candidatus Omnitrophica bacterium]|nr:ATP-binding protein [Candidatus Omnitrophota bacterium]